MDNENNEVTGLDSDIDQELSRLEQQAANEDIYVNPEEEAQAQEKEEALDQAAAAGAAFITGMLETGVKTVYPFVQYEEGQRQMARERLTPLCKKYGGEMPEWLIPWKEEIMAAQFFAQVGLMTYLQVKAHKAQEAANDEGGEDGQESKHGVA